MANLERLYIDCVRKYANSMKRTVDGVQTFFDDSVLKDVHETMKDESLLQVRNENYYVKI